MYRVLVVDDERLIREGLRTLVDWGAQGFEVGAVAADGLEALALIESHPFDLIMADIRMPRMDGLQFLEHLRRMGNRTPVLILSGHAEFEYAKKAAAFKIDGYLLKPVDEDELVRHLAEVRRHLDSREFSALTLVSGVDRVPADWDWGRWQVLLITPLGESGLPQTLSAGAEHRLRQACRERAWGEVFVQPPSVGLILRKVYPGGRNFEHLASELTRLLGDEVRWWTAGAGEVVTSAADVARSAAQARTRLEDRFFHPPGTIVAQERTVSEPGPVPDGPGLTERLALALEAGDHEAVRALLDQTARSLAAWESEEGLKRTLAQLAAGAADRYRGPGAPSAEARTRTATWVAEVWNQPFLEVLVEFLAKNLSDLADRDRAPDPVGLAERMTALIEARYAENLKLETLAEVFHYNSAYLGKLFRSRTGEYFNTYLDRVRIRHAQELLAQGFKVYQVAEMVGYRYVDYFHAKFKKYTGLSPSQYRGQS